MIFSLVLSAVLAVPSEVSFTWDNGKVQKFPVTAAADKKHGPDAIVRIGAGRVPLAELHVRPEMEPYTDKCGKLTKKGKEIVAGWTNLPPASAHKTVFEVREATNGWTQVWIDGSYVKTLPTPKGATNATDVSVGKAAPFDGKLDFAAAQEDGVVAKCHVNVGKAGLIVDKYTRRTPLDGYPEAIHFRLPAAPYAKATIDFSLQDGTNLVPYLVVRLARYDDRAHGIGCTKIEDAVLDLRGGLPPNVAKTADGYRAEVELPIGRCLDYLTGDFIDLEFLGPTDENLQQTDNSQKPRDDLSSSFVLKGVRLEKMDVRTEVVQFSPGNVFTEDEPVKKTAVRLTALADGAAGTLTIGPQTSDYRFAKAGETMLVEYDFSTRPVGLYDLPIEVKSASGLLLRHPARCCATPAAGRMTDKYAAPYGTWIFNRHGANADPKVVGPLLNKAGIRKASSTHFKREDYEKYDFTWTGNVKVPGPQFFDGETGRFKGDKKIADGEAWFVNRIATLTNQNDWTDHAMVWHESAPSWGATNEAFYAAYINEVGRLMRKHFPDIRLKIGNSSASLGAVEVPLRGGAKADYYDSVGLEIPSQTIMPERFIECGFLGMNLTRRLAKAGAGRDIPLDGSYEFVYRTVRDLGWRGEETMAEWQTRDILISLMNGFRLISPQQLMDCTTAYCNTLWGVNGLCGRTPFYYPKKAYLAYAVITKVMDGVAFVREVPTGSSTVYASEFRRSDGRTVTACWCARGNAELESDLVGEILTMNGCRSRLDDGKLTCGTAPVYVVSEKGATSVRIVARHFPDEERLTAEAVKLPPVSAADVEVRPDPSFATSFKSHCFPVLAPCDCIVRDVDDPQEGKVLELVPAITNENDLVTSYTTLVFKKPPVLKGPASVIGLRVKGDSNWGRIRFTLKDAAGKTVAHKIRGGTGSWGCDVLDWPGNLAVNFDGWGDVCQHTDVNDKGLPISPGRRIVQWGLPSDASIVWPVTVESVTVEINRFKPTLFGFADHQPTLRLGGIWYCETDGTGFGPKGKAL